MIFPFREDEQAFCLGCSVQLAAGEGMPCPPCKWPMCGREECWQEGSHHALGECSAIKAARGRPWHVCEKGSCAAYQTSIMMLRCLPLKERDPDTWEKLTNLKHCCPSAQPPRWRWFKASTILMSPNLSTSSGFPILKYRKFWSTSFVSLLLSMIGNFPLATTRIIKDSI